MNKFFVLLLLCVPILNIGRVILTEPGGYFRPYYSDQMYTNLETLFNNSQYRQKYPTTLIADEIVFRYASGAYMRGVDPILINSEITPLGKYIVGVSIALFRTDAVVIVLSALLTLVATWFLGREILSSCVLALVPVALFSTEKLFLNQLRVTPLMDIVQLPYILLSLFAVYKEEKSGKYFFITSVFLGLVMATKSIVPAVLLMITFIAWFLFLKKRQELIRFGLSLPIAGLVFLLSYTRTFLSGYTVVDFLGFQKWILLYQQSKLILPLSFWRLMLLNEWQTWWGDRSILRAEDWSIVWPILIVVPFIAMYGTWKKIMRSSPIASLLLIWIVIYESFLSVGTIVTRFLLPLLPVLYIISTYAVREIFFSRKRV